TISASGIEPCETGVAAIKQLPQPENLTQLQSFLGKINYYHRYIQNFPQLAAPLNKLQRKNVPFTWSKAQEDALNKLKSVIVDATRLTHFNPELPIILAKTLLPMESEQYCLTDFQMDQRSRSPSHPRQ